MLPILVRHPRVRQLKQQRRQPGRQRVKQQENNDSTRGETNMKVKVTNL